LSAGHHARPQAPPAQPLRRVEAPERVACAVCLKSIPRSEARSAEATDYVWYFCGPGCFARWHPGFPKPSLDR
jgi:hypothetical protein